MSLTAQLEQIHGPFIPGMCRVWSKRTGTTYWTTMSYSARGWHDCCQLVDYYQERWGDLYSYEITADSRLCRPRG